MTGAPSSAACISIAAANRHSGPIVLRLRKSRDKFSSVTKREQLAAILQDDRIGEGAADRLNVVIRLIARRTGRARRAATASVRSFPWPIQVGFADPTATVTPFAGVSHVSRQFGCIRSPRSKRWYSLPRTFAIHSDPQTVLILGADAFKINSCSQQYEASSTSTSVLAIARRSTT
jgi:hypothetical protein